MIEGAIFDVDGTLLDSMPIWDQAGAKYLRQLGVTPGDNLGREMFAMSMEEGAAYLREQYSLEESAAQILEGVHGIIEKFYYEEAPLKDGAIEYLEGLKRNKVRISAATSSSRTLIEAAFNRLGLNKYFEQIYTCAEVGAGKNDPAVFLAAMKHMGTARQYTWVFEDALHAILTARHAGFHTVGVYDAASWEQQEQIGKNVDIYLSGFCNFEEFFRSVSDW